MTKNWRKYSWKKSYIFWSEIGIYLSHVSLKVDGNEKRGGQLLSDIVAIEGYLQFERVVSI